MEDFYSQKEKLIHITKTLFLVQKVSLIRKLQYIFKIY
jgi:hypothetical protein